MRPTGHAAPREARSAQFADAARDRLDPFLDAVLLPDEVRAVLAVLEQRVLERQPAAYMTREAWLGEYRFYVDERAIVPRSHIAELIDEGFRAWLPDPEAVSD